MLGWVCSVVRLVRLLNIMIVRVRLIYLLLWCIDLLQHVKIPAAQNVGCLRDIPLVVLGNVRVSRWMWVSRVLLLLNTRGRGTAASFLGVVVLCLECLVDEGYVGYVGYFGSYCCGCGLCGYLVMSWGDGGGAWAE